jgi:hypothetical protein
VPIVSIWEPQPLGTLRACNGVALPLPCIRIVIPVENKWNGQGLRSVILMAACSYAVHVHVFYIIVLTGMKINDKNFRPCKLERNCTKLAYVTCREYCMLHIVAVRDD